MTYEFLDNNIAITRFSEVEIFNDNIELYYIFGNEKRIMI